MASFFLSHYSALDLNLKSGLDLDLLIPAAIVIGVLLAHAAYTDVFCGNVIRNSTSVALLCVSIVLVPFLYEKPLPHLAFVGGVLLILLVIYLVGAMAEGDVKLYLGLVVLLGPASVFLLIISWILIVFYAIPTMMKNIKARKEGEKAQKGKRLGVAPGGPGIALAFPLVLAGYGLQWSYTLALIALMILGVVLFWLNRKLEDSYEEKEKASKSGLSDQGPN